MSVAIAPTTGLTPAGQRPPGHNDSVEIKRATDRFLTEENGRRTHHSLSFGSHYDPANLRFGLLVCHNDDVLQPGAGYPDHPHSDLEIVTWVLSGALQHRDSRGHAGAIEPGRVQAMSAGSGVVHSEVADAAAGPTRFVQAWVLPDENGGEPSYSSGDLHVGDAWTPIAAGAGQDAAARIGATGATLWVARLGAGGTLAAPDAGHMHLFVAGGGVVLETAALTDGDAVRLRHEPVNLTATEPDTELLMWTFD